MRRRLWLFLALALALPASAQTPATVSVYLGPVPNPGGAASKVPKSFEASYADIRKAYEKAAPPDIRLVDDPAQADAFLTITFRGDVESKAAAGVAARPSAQSVTVNGTSQLTPTLLARLMVRTTSEAVEYSGLGNDDGDRTRWSTQATRIYQQAAGWLQANRERLIDLRGRQ